MQETLKKDLVMKGLIDTFGNLEEIKISSNLYIDILESIVSQQLSVKASDTIWKRFENLFPDKKITPDYLLTLPDQTIRDVGCSFSKIKYMKCLSEMVVNNELDLEGLTYMDNEEVIVELTKVKGIGRWTAEMILIFSLDREDVFSIGDLGLRNVVSKLYEVDRDNLEEITKISEKWAPYRSYASRYLWKSLDNTPKV